MSPLLVTQPRSYWGAGTPNPPEASRTRRAVSRSPVIPAVREAEVNRVLQRLRVEVLVLLEDILPLPVNVEIVMVPFVLTLIAQNEPGSSGGKVSGDNHLKPLVLNVHLVISRAWNVLALD